MLRRFRCQEDLRFKIVGPPSAGAIGGPWEKEGSQPNPPSPLLPLQTPHPSPPSNTSLPSLRRGAARLAVSMDAVNRYSGTALPVRPTLFFEFQGATERAVAETAELVRGIARDNGGLEFQWAGVCHGRALRRSPVRQWDVACVEGQPFPA